MIQFSLHILGSNIIQVTPSAYRASHLEAHSVHLPITGDVDLSYLVKVLSSLSTCFSFAISKPSLGRNFKTN